MNISINFNYKSCLSSCSSQEARKSPPNIFGLLIFFILFVFMVKVSPVFGVTTLTETVNSPYEDISIYDNFGGGDGEEYSYIKFNISSVPSNVVIDHVYFSYYPTSRGVSWDDDADISNVKTSKSSVMTVSRQKGPIIPGGAICSDTFATFSPILRILGRSDSLMTTGILPITVYVGFKEMLSCSLAGIRPRLSTEDSYRLSTPKNSTSLLSSE